jgi:rod shape-determining protein MreD
MKAFLYTGVLIFLIPVQSILLDGFSFHGIKPDLALWAVYLVGVLHGEWEGIAMGVLSGIVLDSFTPGRAGMNIFIKALMGFFAGSVGRAFLETHALFHLWMLFLFSILQGFLIYSFLLISGEPLLFGESVGGIIFPQALYDGLVGGAVISLVLMAKRGEKLQPQGVGR